MAKKLSMLLHPGSGYRVKEGYIEIIGGDRRYDCYENGEARLVYRGDKMMLWISKRIPKPKPYKPRDAIAVDINERKVVYGDDKINKEIDTGIDRAHRWKKLAENLQKKYSSTRYPAWRRRKAILNRINPITERLGMSLRTGLGKHLLRSWSYLRSLDMQLLGRI